MAFYDYFREVCNLIDQTEKIGPLSDLSKHSSWVYPYKNIAVISEKPERILVNLRGQIHCDNGPCILYRDGFSVYGLNGVRVSQEIAELPKDKFTKEMIVKEKNADVRREIIRKIGMDKVANLLDYSVIDKLDSYELITFDIGDGRVRPFLKMLNPSMDNVYHVEGVPPTCSTIHAALAFRNGTSEYIKPTVLT